MICILALKKEYYGVGLDVLPDEPPDHRKLIKVWKNNNPMSKKIIIINPHSGYYSTKKSVIEMREKASLNLKTHL